MTQADRTKILLVDDRIENLLAYQSILEGLGLELVIAKSGADALKEVLKHDFAVILLDVNMPGIDGFETAALIRKRKRSAHTPIIFITAFADEFRMSEGYASGAVDFLLSPIVPEVLQAKIRVFVELFRMSEQVKLQAEERVLLAKERMRRLAAEETNRQLNFLAELTALIGRSLDYSATMKDVVRLTVPALGDEAIVVRCESDAPCEFVRAALTDGDVVVDSPSSFHEVADGFAEATARAMASESVVAYPPGAGADARLVVFPLRGQKSTLATFGISRIPSGRSFSAADLTIIEAIASRAAIALENAQLYRDLERSDRHKNEFLSMLAHELRNPLAPIRTAIDVLRLGGNDPAEVQWVSDVVDRQTTHLTRLVDELLDISRITGGKIRLDLAPVDIESVVSAAVETSQPVILSGAHRLSVSLPEETLWVNCDRIRLAQVLGNLLNNAAKYTPQGGTISISVDREQESAVFRIRDSGIGIPREMLAKIFELFTQVDHSLDRSQGGLGIGLTLVQRLVQLHGGTVDATSNGPDQGSEFTVRLPTIRAPAETVPLEVPREPQGRERPLRILVVDDNVDAANTAAWLLRLHKHEVCTAHDGLSALEKAAAFAPQVVVLDLGLPKLDGFEVARRLRRAPETRTALLVAVSGYGQDEHRRQSSEAGFDHHLVKPVNFDALLGVLAEVSQSSPRQLQPAVPGP